MEYKELSKDEKIKIAQQKIINGIKAFIMLLMPLIITYLILFNFLNPVGFYQNLIVLILFPILYFCIFYIEVNL